MGLGPLSIVSLAEAREKAIDCRRQLLNGVDPLHDRQIKIAKKTQETTLEKSRRMTFDECTSAFIENRRSGWRNSKHADQWLNTLKLHASPIFGNLPVEAIDTALVMKAIEPIWATTTETASRLRSRIELILSWAKVRGYRAGENPARWRGHMDNLLPKPSCVKPVEHLKALPFQELGDFMKLLRKDTGRPAMALEFTILTCVRTSEALQAKWSEFNLDEASWLIPAARMKNKRDHRVPLSPRALEIMLNLQQFSDSDFVFPGRHPNKPASCNLMLDQIERMGFKDRTTVHGIARSTFRDWVAECTNHPDSVAEMALAHTIRNKVESAYRRGDLFMKRRQLMNDWAKFCALDSIAPAKVIEMREKVAKS
jgi:integrase